MHLDLADTWEDKWVFKPCICSKYILQSGQACFPVFECSFVNSSFFDDVVLWSARFPFCSWTCTNRWCLSWLGWINFLRHKGHDKLASPVCIAICSKYELWYWKVFGHAVQLIHFLAVFVLMWVAICFFHKHCSQMFYLHCWNFSEVLERVTVLSLTVLLYM